MVRTVPISVVVPTYHRGEAVLSVIRSLQQCDPTPVEVLVHIDKSDGNLETQISNKFPEIRILTSQARLGPGGGRHRCLMEASAPYAVSFDDDSYPVDPDFFYQVEKLFLEYPGAALFGASIWHRNEKEKPRTERLRRMPSYTGCGFAIRLEAYRQIRGFLPRAVAYGMEETDLSLQLFEVRLANISGR